MTRLRSARLRCRYRTLIREFSAGSVSSCLARRDLLVEVPQGGLLLRSADVHYDPAACNQLANCHDQSGRFSCGSAYGKAETESRSARYGIMTTSRDESIRWLRRRSEALRRRHLLGWSLVLYLGALVCAGTVYVSRRQSFGNLVREESAAPAAHQALSSGSREAAGGPGRVPESTLSLANSPETLMTDQVPAEPFSAGEADSAHTVPGNTETLAAGARQIGPNPNEPAPPPAMGTQAKKTANSRQNVRTTIPDRRTRRRAGPRASTSSAATPPELPNVLQLPDQR